MKRMRLGRLLCLRRFNVLVLNHTNDAKAASDLATVTGQDLKSAQNSKALEIQLNESQFSACGTVFTDQQEQIKVLQESGHYLKRDWQEVEKQYGGAARQLALLVLLAR